MTHPIPMTEIWRGPLLESLHLGHAVVCDAAGQVIHAWGDPDAVIYPRSSCKMVQALPLITSGAADAAGLTAEHLALACASHNGAAIHTNRVQRWLADLGLDDTALRCGSQMPDDPAARVALIKSDHSPCQYHNNCSGKHSGFLTLSRYLGAGPDYVEIDHPVQQACRDAFEEVTGQTSPAWPGASTAVQPRTLQPRCRVLARAMAWFASADGRSDLNSQAAVRLTRAMMQHPDLVAGEGRACTALMRAMQGQAAIKTGAEGVFVAILPGKKLGVALKIADGATRASECAIAALLVKLGVLDAAHPATRRYLGAPILNRRQIDVGSIRAAAGFV